MREVVIGVLAHLGEELSEQLPDARPYEAHAVRVEADISTSFCIEYTCGFRCTGELLTRHGGQGVDEVHDGVERELLGAP